MENRLEEDKSSTQQRKQLKSAVSTKNFSILPDLATGWRPKVLKIHPPILIKYKQSFINNLIINLHQNNQNKVIQQSNQSNQTNKLNKIAYLGPRHYNSFSFHNKVPHDYHMRFSVKNEQLPQNFQAQIQKYKKLQNRPYFGMNPVYNNNIQNLNKQNYSIKFQSNFESGNLDLVIEAAKNEYDLFLRPDTNTCGHTQWFYFKVFVKKQQNNINNINNNNSCNSFSQKQPNQSKISLKFNICNNKKYRTLYGKGMKPYVFSHKLHEQKKIGWHQNGNNVVYKKYQSNYEFKQSVNSCNGNKNNQNDNGKNQNNKQGDNNITMSLNSNIMMDGSNNSNAANISNTVNTNNFNNSNNNNFNNNIVQSSQNKQLAASQLNYFSLSFQYEFQFQQDCIQFAYCPPYTYSQLKKDISKLKKKVNQQQSNLFDFIKYIDLQILQQRLCISLSGLEIPLLTITNNEGNRQQNNDENIQKQSTHSHLLHNPHSLIKKQNQNQQNHDKNKHKKVIFATARIHPGQSNGSHVMNGFLNFITSKQASNLRDKCIFKIVPMINPDGVILGNFRTGLAGKDLNRQFKVKNLQLLPQISSIKEYITKLKFQKGSSLLYYLDLHGHSTKKNSFVYGPEYDLWDTKFERAKIFPKLVSFKTPMFKLNSCVYKVANYKKSTARAFLLGFVPFCYTVESSIGIYLDQKGQNINFTIEKWQQLGKKIGQGLQIAIDRLNEDNLKAILKKSKQKKSMILKQIDLQNTSKQSISITTTLRGQSSTKQLTTIPLQPFNRQISSADSIPISLLPLQPSQHFQILSKKYLQPIKHFKHKQKHQIQLQFPQINQQIRQSDGQSDGKSDCQSQTNDFSKKQYQQMSKQIMKVVKDFQQVVGLKDNLNLNKKISINNIKVQSKKDREKLNSLCKKKNVKRKESLSTSTKNGLIVKNNKNTINSNNNSTEEMKLVPSLKYKLAKLINQGYINNKKNQKIKRNNSQKKIGGGLTAINFQRSFIGGRV